MFIDFHIINQDNINIKKYNEFLNKLFKLVHLYGPVFAVSIFKGFACLKKVYAF
jgi:hypothetical protein